MTDDPRIEALMKYVMFTSSLHSLILFWLTKVGMPEDKIVVELKSLLETAEKEKDLISKGELEGLIAALKEDSGA